MEPRYCVAPLDDDGERLCPRVATTDRVIEETVCPLCEEHAREVDEDAAQEETT